MVNKEKFIRLLDRYLLDDLTAAEEEELFSLIGTREYERALDEHVQMVLNKYPKEQISMDPVRTREIIGKILQSGNGNAKIIPLRPIRNIRRVAIAAAVILVILSAGTYFLFFKKPGREIAKSEEASSRYKNDVPPGQNKAVLTLANGKKIILDSAASGKLAQQGQTAILNKNGELIYHPGNFAPSTDLASPVYNTLATGKGETYPLVLADGSKVWLNSASSIRFPVAFSGKERRVEITGEAYFEVSHDAKKAFVVAVRGMEVQVLGTHFNIKSYEDEPAIRTSLLEGSIRLMTNGNQQPVILRPGEQAAVAGNKILTTNITDPEQVIAWKNGKFIFTGDNIQSVMHEIDRWYDVDVNYKGKITDEEFVGVISRHVNVSEILKMLEKTGTVSFTIEGKKITVSSNKE